MSNIKIINVRCTNNHLLFEKYKKVGKGRLIKCYINEIKIDHVGVRGLLTDSLIFCPKCKEKGIKTRIGRIGMIHGRPSVIINHGKTIPIRT